MTAPARPRRADAARARPSDRLRLTIRLGAGRLDGLSARFWDHPRLGALFPEYYLTLYASMRATVPLLDAAAARARELAADDPMAAALEPYLVQHAREELHHDDWLLEDMALLGMDVDAARRRQAPADVAEMIGAQHYWLSYTHPLTLLGCFAVLEGTPPEVETLDAVAERTGLPRAALRTLYKHAQLDPHHRDDLDELLDSLPLSRAHQAMLGLSALHVVDRLADVLSRLLEPYFPPEA